MGNAKNFTIWIQSKVSKNLFLWCWLLLESSFKPNTKQFIIIIRDWLYEKLDIEKMIANCFLLIQNRSNSWLYFSFGFDACRCLFNFLSKRINIFALIIEKNSQQYLFMCFKQNLRILLFLKTLWIWNEMLLW